MENSLGEHSKLVVFADDTNAIISADNTQSLNLRVNEALEIFHNWFTINGLKVNASKTNLMLFRTTSRNKSNLNCALDGVHVSMVEVVKFLGVHVDCNLNWKPELESLENTISSACYVLRSLRNDIDMKQLKKVYYALIESRLRYSILCWGGSYEYNIQKAFVLQKRAIRTMVCIRQQESCKRHFVNLNILTVPSLYALVLLTHFSKYVHQYETEEERKLRESTRRKDFKTTNIPKLNIVKHGTCHMSVKIFNKLPDDIKLSLYKRDFKTKLKRYFLEGCYYSINDI